MSQLESVELVTSQGLASIVSAEGARHVAVREVTGFDELATALRMRLPEHVTVHTSPRLRVPSGAVLVVCRPDVLEQLRATGGDAIAPRVVLVDVLRADALNRAERLGLAAAIGTARYLRWQTNPSEETGSGVYGRKDVAARIGATWSELPQLQSERYALLTHAGMPDLVALLAAYIEAYAELHL
jgi:hypothetical protein